MNTHTRKYRSLHRRAAAHTAPTPLSSDASQTNLDDIWNLLTDELTLHDSGRRVQQPLRELNLWSVLLTGDHDDI